MLRRFLIGLLLALASAAPWTAARAGETVTFGITSLTALSVPHYIGEAKKFYEAENISVDTIVAGSAARVVQQVVAGSLNMGQVATDQALRAMMQDAPARMIAGVAANAPFRVVAAKNVKTWKDLKGKTITVGGVRDVTLYFLRVMARKNGLADDDYDLIYSGGTPDRFAQLLSGAVGAAVLTNPHDFTALEQGFVDLGSVPQYLPHWAQNNILIDLRWGAQHRAAAEAFLRGYIRASDFFYDPANRDEVIALLVKQTKTTPQIAAATYDLYQQEQVFAPGAALSLEGIKANLDAFVAMGEITSAPPAARFVDESYLAAATSKATAH